MQLPRNPVPTPIDSFVGRERELRQISIWLAERPSRLLTLVGPGGVGKTRLTLEASRRDPAIQSCETVYLDLTRLSDSSLFGDLLCEALSLPPAPSDHALSSASEALRNRESLLVLDNFEHVRDAAPDLVKLLIDCPMVRAIVTSRLPLRVIGEQVLRLGTLPLPSHNERTDSTELFLRRAEAANMGWEPRNMTEIGELCRRLDGLPLALEIAAARVRNVPVDRILADLDTRKSLLDSQHIGGTGRVQSLNGAIDWSVSLLTTEQKRHFARLSVFRGRFSLEDAKSVCRSDVIEETLVQLAEQSLLLAERTELGQRYRLLETIRLFAAGMAENTGEWEPASRAHAERFLTLARAFGERLSVHEASAELHAVALEIDNIRAGMDWCIRAEMLQETADYGISMARYWQLRGPFSEAAERLGDAVSAARILEDPPRTAGLLLDCGILHALYGDNSEARAVFEEARRLYRELSDRSGEARALNLLGTAADVLGDLDLAEKCLRESLAIRDEMGDGLRATATLNNLALVIRKRGQLREADAMLRRALAFYERNGRDHHAAVALSNLAEIALETGELSSAESLHVRSGEIHRLSGDLRGTATTNAGLGDVALARGDRSNAQIFYEKSATEFEAVGDMRLLADVRRKLESFKHKDSLVPERTDPGERDKVKSTESYAIVTSRSRNTEALLRVWLFGSFRMEPVDPNATLPAWGRRAHRQLFQFLCLSDGRPVTRGSVIERFWPHLDPEPAQHALRKALSDIRSVLSPLDDADRIMVTTREAVEVRTGDGIWVDAVEYRSLISRAQNLQIAGDNEKADLLIKDANLLYRGEICAGESGSDWLDDERQRFADIHTAALLALARSARRAEQWDETERFAAEALAGDPCLEPACRLRMIALTSLGRRAEALRAFESFRTAMRDELAAEPSKRTFALAEQIRMVSASAGAHTIAGNT